MADDKIVVAPDSTGKAVDNSTVATGAGTVYRQRVSLGDAAAANNASVSAAGALKVDGSGVTQPVSGTVTTTPPSNASENVAQFGGTNVVTGTGAGGAGIPRVTVSNDSSILIAGGDVDHDAVDTAKVEQVGGYASPVDVP